MVSDIQESMLFNCLQFNESVPTEHNFGKEWIDFHETLLNMKWGDAHEVSLECP